MAMAAGVAPQPMGARHPGLTRVADWPMRGRLREFPSEYLSRTRATGGNPLRRGARIADAR
eukprot:scaffold3900_cov258-Pinguiococcus_pyrenoidosus.AAC.5